MESPVKKQTFKGALEEINALLDPDEQLTEQQLSKLRSERVDTVGSPRQRAAITAVLGEDAGAACDWQALCQMERGRSEVKDLVISSRDERILELEREADPRRRHWIAQVKGTAIVLSVCAVLITWGLWRPALTIAALNRAEGIMAQMWELAQENARLKKDYMILEDRLTEIEGMQQEIDGRLGVK